MLRSLFLVMLALAVHWTAEWGLADPSREDAPSAGRLEIRRSSLGCPEIKLTLAELPSNETAVSLFILRSTTDLSTARNDHQSPVARLALQAKQQAYMDTLAPENVLLYYQLETKTSLGNTYLSNVEAVILPPPDVHLLKKPKLLIDKSTYSLLLLDDRRVVRRFPIALGANAVYRKLHRDRAGTPEGIYRISQLQAKSDHHRAMEIDFPNEVDRERYNFFADQGMLPYPTPEIGGEVLIHGDGIESNWTWGRLAMRTADIDWLFSRKELKPGLEVRIVGTDLRPEDLSLEEELSRQERLEIESILTKLGYLNNQAPNSWRQALNRFQKEKGLTITGILDQVTRARILKIAKGDFG